MTGLDGPGIAARTGLPHRRVKHLEQTYRGRPLVQFLTYGLVTAVRRDWALGQHSRAELAGAHLLDLDQVERILSRAPGTHAEGPYTDPSPRRRRPQRKAAARG